ncbi:hypothetical protein Nepgr_006795 [Nepenthes gracilis]|uniref:Uncharacterized protein n=1 Tax=Nepenthes gracilis TaxID=150966 RepID=A0AAD3S630_NEPGR|nr:hypothetical protein Nepgr_006795 [Nepenthes gracilis]
MPRELAIARESCSGTRCPAALAASAIVSVLLVSLSFGSVAGVKCGAWFGMEMGLHSVGLATACALFFGGSDPVLLGSSSTSSLVRDYIMVVELLCLGEVAVATGRFSDRGGSLGPVAGQDTSAGFCCVSMQLMLFMVGAA